MQCWALWSFRLGGRSSVHGGRPVAARERQKRRVRLPDACPSGTFVFWSLPHWSALACSLGQAFSLVLGRVRPSGTCSGLSTGWGVLASNPSLATCAVVSLPPPAIMCASHQVTILNTHPVSRDIKSIHTVTASNPLSPFLCHSPTFKPSTYCGPPTLPTLHIPNTHDCSSCLSEYVHSRGASHKWNHAVTGLSEMKIF